MHKGGNMNKLKSIFIFIFILTLFSCASRTVKKNYSPYSPTIIDAAYKIADSLSNIDRGSILIVASFVDVNNLEESSPFGRMISEHIASRLCQNGFNVKEIKLRKKSIFLDKGNGEFLLSRDVKDVGIKYDVTYFIAGTYAQDDNNVYVSARAISPEDNLIASSCDVYLPLKSKRLLFTSH